MKIINTLRAAALSVTALALGACHYLDPINDGTLSEEEIFANAKYFCGPLMEAYNTIPTAIDFNMDIMTDNAVHNNFSGAYYLGGTGALRPDNNPLDVWDNAYKQIRQLNIFLSKMIYDDGAEYPLPLRFFSINSPADLQANIDTFWRLKGEAYFLRAWYMASLLRNFGGQTEDGKVLGVPIVGERILNAGSDLNLPRATYDECVEAILTDLKIAYDLLPLQYDAKDDDRVVGAKLNGRASGIAALALKARVLLYAASPVFNKPYDPRKWVDAANAAGEAIVAAGGLLPLSAPVDYYFTKLNNGAFENRDIFFRSNVQGSNRATENANYPRGMYGSAALGVTQNFVDAFPDSSGYPITDADSSYDNDRPYENRDPRLPLFVAMNGSTMGPGNYYTIESYVGGKDGYDPMLQTSRTSYYLRKLMRTGTVKLIPNDETTTSRANIHLGMPELYLNYAEAANEAWGPASDGGEFGFTAADVVRVIHGRYATGAALEELNTYLNTKATADIDKFRELIHNERRIELSFEGHHFYDLRRWLTGENLDNDLAKLNVVVYGMKITPSGGGYTYEKVPLETRRFASVYQPIPYKEVFSAGLPQNRYWK